MRGLISVQILLVLAVIATACTAASRGARTPHTTACGPVDASAAEMHARLARTFGHPMYEPVRRTLNLPVVAADSVLQVLDGGLCTHAANAVARRLGYEPPSVAYLFRAQNVYALFQPTRPEMTDHVHFLTSTMQYIGTGVR